MRGENTSMPPGRVTGLGSSPHARGKLEFHHKRAGFNGLIPACAGKTQAKHLAEMANGAHPRMRGENLMCGLALIVVVGSSPHARGKRRNSTLMGLGGRLIPACAGKTLADLDQHRAFEPIRYNLSRTITDIKPRQRREKLEPLSSKGSPPPLRGYPSI